MTKYIIKRGSVLYLNKRVRKDNTWNKYKETKIGKIKDINPIFKHAITAIAYSVDPDLAVQPLFDTTWDKREILQALDFWISDKVLENERILFLEDELKDVEEIELKNLIKLRKKVNALPNDTTFSRTIHDTNLYIYNRLETWVVQFYQQKKLPARSNNVTATLTLDDINFRSDGRRWDLSTANALAELAGYFANTSSSNDEVSGRIGGGRHSSSRVLIHPNPDGSFNPTVLVRTRERLNLGDRVVHDPNNPGHVRTVRSVVGSDPPETPIGTVVEIQGDGIVAINSGNVTVTPTTTPRDIQRDIRLTRALSQVGGGTDPFSVAGNPDNWTITAVNGTSGNRWFRVIDARGRIIQSGLDTAQDAQRYISQQREIYQSGRNTERERISAITNMYERGVITRDEARRALSEHRSRTEHDHPSIMGTNQIPAEITNRYHDGIEYTQPSNPHEWNVIVHHGGGFALVDRNGTIVRIEGTDLRYPTEIQAREGLEGHRQLWDNRQRRSH